jgi:transcriptional regulator with XRE-family HTH domain
MIVRETSELRRLARARRRELNITQQDLADLTGVHRTTIIAFEQGHDLLFDRTLLILHTLGIDLDANVRGRREER